VVNGAATNKRSQVDEHKGGKRIVAQTKGQYEKTRSRCIRNKVRRRPHSLLTRQKRIPAAKNSISREGNNEKKG